MRILFAGWLLAVALIVAGLWVREPGARSARPRGGPSWRSKQRVLSPSTTAGRRSSAFYQRAVRSSLDADRIADSRDVGTATAFDRRLDEASAHL